MQRTHLGSHSRWYVQNRPQILRSSRILLCLESNSIHPQVPCLPFVGVGSLFQCYADVRAFLPTVTAYVKGLGTVRLIGGQNILHHSNPAECITSCAPSPHRQLLLASRLHFTVHVIRALKSNKQLDVPCLAPSSYDFVCFLVCTCLSLHHWIKQRNVPLVDDMGREQQQSDPALERKRVVPWFGSILVCIRNFKKGKCRAREHV